MQVEPLIYEPLSTEIDNDIASSNFQKVYIEIVPLHKKYFEITSLFEFIDSLTIEYDCIEIDSIVAKAWTESFKFTLCIEKVIRLKIIFEKCQCILF